MLCVGCRGTTALLTYWASMWQAACSRERKRTSSTHHTTSQRQRHLQQQAKLVSCCTPDRWTPGACTQPQVLQALQQPVGPHGRRPATFEHNAQSYPGLTSSHRSQPLTASIAANNVGNIGA
jgi:hypothetical protein